MPTYEYECKNCSHSFEKFQAMSDPPLKECPRCGKEVRRLIFGGMGVIFKGSGFYVNDKSKETKPSCAKCPAAGETGKCPASEAAAKPASEAKLPA